MLYQMPEHFLRTTEWCDWWRERLGYGRREEAVDDEDADADPWELWRDEGGDG
jgi:hypothetical protein